MYRECMGVSVKKALERAEGLPVLLVVYFLCSLFDSTLLGVSIFCMSFFNHVQYELSVMRGAYSDDSRMQ